MSTNLPTGPAAEPPSASPPAPVQAPPAPVPLALQRPVPPPPGIWPRTQVVLFRFALCYALLYALPEPFDSLLRGLGTAGAELGTALGQPWLAGAPFSWCAAAATWLGGASGLWSGALAWLSEQGLTPYPVIVQPTGSGDTALEIARTLAVALASLLVALVWSLLARRPTGYPRAGRWLHLYVRWWLAFVLLLYGVAKLYVGQFGELNNTRLLSDFGDLSPMGLLWSFMAASPAYETLSGVLEILPALLLFHRRTALLGALLAVVVMANVVALNWCYDVPVKLYSTHLLVAALALMLPWRGSLWALFVANRSCPPPDLAVVQRGWLRWLLTCAGALLLAAHFTHVHVEYAAYAAQTKEQGGELPALYGVWEVEGMKAERAPAADGAVPELGEVPPTDATRWRRFVVGRGGRAFFEDVAGGKVLIAIREDLANGTIAVTPRGGGDAVVWQAQRGKAVRKMPHPEPLTRDDFSKEVERERETLALTGSHQGKRVELQLVRRVFDLQRGFHFRQELPYNR